MPSKIKKRGKDSYLLTVVKGYDAKGRQITHTKTVKCSSEKEAEKQYALFIAEIEKGQVASSGKMTLEDFISIWLEKHAQRQLAPKTTLRYKQLLNLWIIPALGHIRLDRLKPPQILDFYNNLTEDGIRKDGKPGALAPSGPSSKNYTKYLLINPIDFSFFAEMYSMKIHRMNH